MIEPVNPRRRRLAEQKQHQAMRQRIMDLMGRSPRLSPGLRATLARRHRNR